MKTKDLAKIIYNTDGEPFTCTFVKRSNGETRILHGQLGVQKDLKGVGLSYDPKENDLIGVFDLDKDGYRMIPVEGLISVEFQGKTYIVESEES
jgi:hypothetical protein